MVWFVEASNSCSGGDRLLPELAKLRRFVINDKKNCIVFSFHKTECDENLQTEFKAFGDFQPPACSHKVHPNKPANGRMTRCFQKN